MSIGAVVVLVVIGAFFLASWHFDFWPLGGKSGGNAGGDAGGNAGGNAGGGAGGSA